MRQARDISDWRGLPTVPKMGPTGRDGTHPNVTERMGVAPASTTSAIGSKSETL
jgi:hypothetical protein